VRKPLPTDAEIAELPADGGPEFNRLIHEKSPYLLQHARNPVDWYPWGPEAFAAAKAQDKPVFLSVGYSTCHWCHVMEHESFEDEDVAKLMNASFICVKVDREERPDIDAVYMEVTQAMTGRGGWPMTVIMTAEKEPFFAGTYFPKSARGQRYGMMELVPEIMRAWNEERDKVTQHAATVTKALAERNASTRGDTALSDQTLERAARQLADNFDAEHGGFRSAPKFPVPHNLRFLLRWAQRSGDEQALAMVEKTLHGMRVGGMYDHVGYGFHRYSTDRSWFLPHFEKMLYDQALLALAYTEAWQVTGKDEYRRVADEVFTYVTRDMTSPEGGFYSAEDADSEGEEGLFYLWKPEELVEVLGEEDGKFAARVWNVVPGGNFADQATGQKTGDSILHFQQSVAEIAGTEGLSVEEFEARLEGIRTRLFENREGRIHPLKDDKVLADWNGLMIAAFAYAARAFDEPAYAQTARKAADFVLDKLVDEGGRLRKRYRTGSVDFDGLLEDYAFVIWGLIEVFQTTQDAHYLERALALQKILDDQFWDDEVGGYFLTPDDGEALIVRTKEIYDGAIPSGNSVACLNLLRLGRLTGESEFEHRADEVLQAFSGSVAAGPSNYTQLLLALDFQVGPSLEIVVAGSRDAADTRAMLRELERGFVPNKVVVLRPDEGAEAVQKLAPYTEYQTSIDGKATAYVCQNFTCQRPTTDVEQMLANVKAGLEPADD